MARVFVGVGGYKGESVMAALDPIFEFDKCYVFEPVTQLAKDIQEKIGNDRLIVISAGLSDHSGSIPIYGSGTLGGTIFADAPWVEVNEEPVSCDFLDAAEFFESTFRQGDKVVMKLNCEGSEVAILDRLLTSGADRFLEEVLIDFDAAKIPSRRDEVADIQERLRHAEFSFHSPSEVQYGMINNYGGIRNWLLRTVGESRSLIVRIKSWVYQIPFVLDRRFNGYYKMRLLTKSPFLARMRAWVNRSL